MKENLTKAFVAFYYFCLLIYVPLQVGGASAYAISNGFLFNIGRVGGEPFMAEVDWDRLILQLLAGTCVLLMIRYLIPVFSKEPERSDSVDD